VFQPRDFCIFMDYHYLFGPVPSRRFGRSLGIDLVPDKTCSYDCVFCEVGRTRLSTCERAEYVPAGAVVAEFQQWLASDGSADVITLAGSGEPTLHLHFGDIIDAVKASCDIPVVLLTNGSLFHRPDVRAAAAKADIVKGSLSAWDPASFQRVNRPAPGATLELLVGGLSQFRKEFSGKLWLEVFLLKGINDDPADVAKIAALAERVAPDVIQLNTVVRPPAEDSAQALSRSDLELLAPLFSPPAEIIARILAGASRQSEHTVTARHVLAMLTRRPCTVQDIADAFGLSAEGARELTQALLRGQSVTPVERADGVYFSATADGGIS